MKEQRTPPQQCEFNKILTRKILPYTNPIGAAQQKPMAQVTGTRPRKASSKVGAKDFFNAPSMHGGGALPLPLPLASSAE